MFGAIVRKPRSSRGFTLIELLVVIAIIAILAAILFPIFTKAKDKAKLTRCLVHMGQIGKAIQSYTDDHDGRYPIGPDWNYTAQKAGAINSSSPYRSGWWTCQFIGGIVRGRGPYPQDRPLYKYTSGNLEMWKCPGAMRQGITPGDPNDVDFDWRAFGSSYCMNGVMTCGNYGAPIYTLMGDGYLSAGTVAPRKTSEVKNTSKILLLGERTMHHYWYKMDSPDFAPIGHMSDKPFSPVVFCDGHASTVMFTNNLADPDGKWGFIQKGWHPAAQWKKIGL